MATYAVLLRGINVGGKSKVAMADLRDLLGELGLTAVKTLLQSGNAVFDSPDEKNPEQLKSRIEKALGREGRILIRWSGTEPKLRIMLEGPDEGRIRAWAKELVEEARKDVAVAAR